MAERNNRKNTASADSSKRRKQQSTTKRVESASKNKRITREKKSTVQNVRRDNPRVAQANPRRTQRRTKLYAFLVASILIILGVILFLMLFTFTASDLAADAEKYLNLFGYIGAHIADIMLTLFGLAAFLFSAVCLLMGICSVCGRQIDVNASSIVGMILLILGCSPIAEMMFSGGQILEHVPGGVLGQWSVAFATSHMPGSAFFAICLGVTIFGGLLVTETSLKSFFRGLWRIICWVFKSTGKAFAAPFKREPSPAVAAADVESLPENSSQEMNERLLYEDSPSQLLNDKESDLDERAAVVQKTSEAEDFDGDEPSDVVADDSDGDALSEMDYPETRDNVHEDDHEDDISDIDDPDGLLAIEHDEVAPVIGPDTPDEVEEKAPEKPAKSEALGDIMARIIKSGPKKRSIKKRSPSVPAIEPEFEYDSILAPEQISAVKNGDIDVQSSSQKVLGNWKPRSIARKTVNPVETQPKRDNPQAGMPTLDLADIRDENVRKAIAMPAPSVPSHMTTDLLAQLQTEDLEIESKMIPAVTKIVPKSSNLSSALADTADIRIEKKSANERMKLESPRAGCMEERETGISPKVAQRKNELGKNVEKSDKKTAVPVSDELRALMAEAGFKGAKPNYSDLSFDVDVPDSELRDSNSEFSLEEISAENLAAVRSDDMSLDNAVADRPNGTPKMHGSFVVAEEKKRASEDELREAEKARLKIKKQAEYEFPPLSLLHYDPATQKGLDNEALRLYANKIEEKLAEYHIQGQVVQICPGPIITRFEYQPAPGTKVSKIASLTDDLMMALEIASVRILAPIPGKGVIGIEIPNEKRNTIFFKEIIASRQFTESKSILTIALGKDPEGEPVVSDLAKMPHLLVAGSTGSGKSVGINTMICSLLYNASPDDVKLILVDPKCLELSIYEGIPHLLVPPITTPAETAAALDWACEEMDERYRKLSALGVRNIGGYNEQLKNPTLPKAIDAIRERDEDGNPKYTHMPYIVIVVDEFADLMMTAGKEIERSIARLAQKARAAGIHIILATQRPSTNVITGIIKANFPTRLAFRVFSYVDSRTILDQKGAESLLGMGDSLFLPPNTAVLQRVHGAFVSDDEVQAIVGFLAKQRAPEYNLDITTPKEVDGSFDDCGPVAPSSDFDPLYDQAVQIVAETRQASASFLQRRMSIGFNRAARIIEQMEREGVVGPQKGQKPREVLIQPI